MEIIIIILLSFLAATISGVAGFGGGLILLPILTWFISPKLAIPLLTIAQLFGNGSRVLFNYKELRWKPVLFFLLGAVPFSILGSRLLIIIEPKIVKICIGVFLILIVVYKRFIKTKFHLKPIYLIPGGAITGFLSGLIGSAGPLAATLFLGLNLPPLSYISSEALAASIMHIVKIFVYGKYALLTKEAVVIGIVSGITMVGGSYVGKIIISKVSKKIIALIIEILLVISAVQLIFL